MGDDNYYANAPSLTLEGFFAPGGVVESASGEIRSNLSTKLGDDDLTGKARRKGVNDAANNEVNPDAGLNTDGAGERPDRFNDVEDTDGRRPWVALLQLPKATQYGGTSLLDGVHRAMMLGASAVLVLASFSQPHRLLHRITGGSFASSSPVSLFKRPVVILRAAEFNVSLLVQALASKIKASVAIAPRRDDDSSDFQITSTPKSLEQTTPVNGGSYGDNSGVLAAGSGVTFWGRCGRFSEWHGVVCLDERLETASTSSAVSGCKPEASCADAKDGRTSSTSSSSLSDSGTKSSSDDIKDNNNKGNGFHPWNVVYSASISLCVFLLLKVIGSSTSLSMMMATLRPNGGGDEELLLPPTVGEKDVEISLRRLARDALRAMPIKRYQISPKRSPESEPLMCPICLSNFTWNQKIRVLPCHHEFHPRCADPWLVAHRTCPLCKLNIVCHWATSQL